MKRQEQYLRAARRDFEYNISVFARAISAGSKQIVKGLDFCNSSYSSLLRIDTKSQRRLTSSKESEPESPPYVSTALQRAKELTLKTDEWSQKALNVLLLANGAVTNCVIQSKVGKMLSRTRPGESLLASVAGVDQSLGAVAALGKGVICSTYEAATGIVASSFGEEAGRITGDVFNIAGHALSTVWNVTIIAKMIYLAKSASTSGLKKSLKASAKRRMRRIRKH